MLAKRFLLSCLLMIAFSISSQLNASQIHNLRLWPAPDNLRLVFDLSAPVEHQVFSLQNPSRLVIDIKDAQLKVDLTKINLTSTPIKQIRSAPKDKNSLRVVLDLSQSIKARSFLLKPNEQYGHRLVVDLVLPKQQQQKQQATSTKLAKAVRERKIVIALDPGHGGEDPGAIGPTKAREKIIVLAIAKELQRILQRDPAYEVLLTRTGDYYVGLRERVNLARKAKADLFISIHADAYRSPQPSGSSVYVLSNRGATSETGRWLANRENRADLIGGVEGSLSLADKDPALAEALIDLSMTSTLTESFKVGYLMLKELSKINKLHKKDVEQAGFAVLKSLDMPSLLVEAGFISNAQEEARLRSPTYQRKLAENLATAIKAYFTANPPPNSYLAKELPNVYQVKRGDTLSLIAQRHGVSLAQLRKFNNLNSDAIQVGQSLRIPTK